MNKQMELMKIAEAQEIIRKQLEEKEKQEEEKNKKNQKKAITKKIKKNKKRINLATIQNKSQKAQMLNLYFIRIRGRRRKNEQKGRE